VSTRRRTDWLVEVADPWAPAHLGPEPVPELPPEAGCEAVASTMGLTGARRVAAAGRMTREVRDGGRGLIAPGWRAG
jgi:hypothetical protein